MKFKKILSVILATATVMACIIVPSTATVTSSDFTADELECSSYDIRKYTDPFWEGNIVYNEIVHPIRNENGSLPMFELMYEATEIVSVMDYRLRVTYTEGIDYMLIGGEFYVIPNGNIPVMDYEDMHPTSVPSGYGDDEFMPYYPHADNPGHWEYWTGGDDVCEMSLAVTYIHNDTWDAPIPDSQESRLPGTFDKLKNKEELTIVVAGDSVATGAMSSGFLGMSPYAEAYPEMTERALREKYSNDKIDLINSAIGGTMSNFDEAKMNNTIINYAPDLVILNFGMNDSSCGRIGIPKSEFKANNALQMEYIQEKLPDCEILLVSSLYGNRYTFPAERYEEHAAALHELAAEYDGVGVADPQAIEKYLIEETGKDYICFTADNMVHPGDLGMRLTAQSIIEALSFEDISTYREFVINKMIEIADLDNQDETKTQEILELIAETEAAISTLDEEWDINAVMDKAYVDLNVIIIRCDTHTYVDTIIAPTCKAEGYTYTECSVCGHNYTHSTVPNLGGEHVMDSGRQTIVPTYKTPGEITYSCARCPYSYTDKIDVLTDAPSLSGKGMVHISNSNNYMASNIQPYTYGKGFVEFDFCPLDIERYSGTPYVGIWFSSYAVTACYNFAMQEVQIVETSLPFGGGTVHASVPYSWSSDGGEYEYNWKKFAVELGGTTVRIYIDGELVLEDTKSFYRATSEVALLYSNGECYMDNFKVVRGDYDPTTGAGGTVLGSWDFDTSSSYNSFFKAWGQQYATKKRVVPTAASVTTGNYRKHICSGTLVDIVESGCGYGGYDQYTCDMCAGIYFDNFTAPACEAHTLINQTLFVRPTTVSDGKYKYNCETCDMTFTEVIPKGTVIEIEEEDVIKGDVNNDGSIDLVDLAELSKFLRGVTEEVYGSDINSDGSIDLIDYALLKNIMKGLNS